MTVRYALPTDLAALAAVEAECFPAAEAASAMSSASSIQANRFTMLHPFLETGDAPGSPARARSPGPLPGRRSTKNENQ